MMDHMRNYNELCRSISVDEPLKTLFRVNGESTWQWFHCHSLILCQDLEWVVPSREPTPSPTAGVTGCAATQPPPYTSAQVNAPWKCDTTIEINPDWNSPPAVGSLFLYDVCQQCKMSEYPAPVRSISHSNKGEIKIFHVSGRVFLSCQASFMIDQH